MTKLHHEIQINAPVLKVWHILANLEEVAKYNPLVKHTDNVGEKRTCLGAERHCDFKDGGFSNERVIKFEPERVIGIEIVKSSWHLVFCRWYTKLEPKNGGTFVSQDLEYEVKFGVFGKLMDTFIMKRKFNQILGDIFMGMKKYAEKSL